MADQAEEVYVIFNNKSYNYAQTNSRQMMELLRRVRFTKSPSDDFSWKGSIYS